MSKISHTEPSQHIHITHWTHRIEEMEWFSELAANDLGFGLSLAKTCHCQTFGKCQCNIDMACPKSATQSRFNIVTSLIRPIWRK
jgi:hypothetical protein